MKNLKDAIETIKYKNHTIAIVYDDSPDNPRDWDNFGTIVAFHDRYRLGDKTKLNRDDFGSFEDLQNFIEQQLGAICVLPVYMYEHGGVALSTSGFSCQWDSGQIGFIYCTKDNLKRMGSEAMRIEKVKEYLEHEIETYGSYLNGQVFAFRIYNEQGEMIDSCGGFYSIAEAMETGQGSV